MEKTVVLLNISVKTVKESFYFKLIISVALMKFNWICPFWINVLIYFIKEPQIDVWWYIFVFRFGKVWPLTSLTESSSSFINMVSIFCLLVWLLAWDSSEWSSHTCSVKPCLLLCSLCNCRSKAWILWCSSAFSFTDIDREVSVYTIHLKQCFWTGGLRPRKGQGQQVQSVLKQVLKCVR